ncbi:MAG: tRNA lysidine(34) synthetase TilS [Arenimonas sp.]|uniref:tRNA lysidine(34) synthetase TilS n=1 Tax=Arenimonas sp. TaxID=1872635 RepID=UPI0025C162A0|nr:tRNA lysidine(34) synthetase TilS [Arenimonas sp.]MBW8369215.1 tRNA lysidine(34) synthetase TilS [Arenimonas sp.]
MVLTLPAAPADGPVTVAFSGGMDSTVLLHLAAQDPRLRDRGLRALHVDHGLHPDSAHWAQACGDVCAGLGVSFQARRVTVGDRSDGLEAAARDARHEAFAAHQAPGELIALAHHRDDQAETLLLRLLRGSGDGLGAMRTLRPFGRGWLWRPLLAVPQSQLHAYALEHGLRWIEDPSNASQHHDRNFLRHRVLPVLRERWPQADAGFARSAGLLAAQQDLLTAEDASRLARVQGPDPATLSVPALLAQPPDWQHRLLRRWTAQLGLPMLSARALGTISAELMPARADARAKFAWSGAVIHRWRDLLHAGWQQPPLPADWRAAWDGTQALPLPGGDCLQLAPARAFDAPLQVRAGVGGVRLVRPGRSHSSELKHVLQDLGVPPWQRARLPLLFAPDGTLLAAGDVALSGQLHRWLAEHGTRLERLPAST